MSISPSHTRRAEVGPWWRWPGLLLVVALAGAAPDARAAAGVEKVPSALPGAPPFPAAVRARLAQELGARGPGYLPRTRNLRPDGSPLYSNRLLFETSPYLQQHAHNPVNWYAWGDEPFAEAKRLGRPVLLSIGYSTCHWCHVMEEESFDSAEIAAYLNEHFIAVKVDREARPDVDAIYMAAVHAMNQSGGWPLNVWVTPDRKPFYGGTYFPPEDRGGRAGFPSVLRSIEASYRRDPERVESLADRISARIAVQLEGVRADSSQALDAGLLKAAARIYARAADRRWGGVGQRTKFPSGLPVRFLLRYHRRTGDSDALEVASLALEKMAAGGMRDHVGGGFHRYSTDPRWLIPHFEKMLYDNALLARAYLEAGQLTRREDFTAVAREILRYVAREMTSPEGGFYSATDADSPNPAGEAEEGWFFTWTPREIEAALGAELAPVAISYYGVTPGGNLEGRTVLHAWRDLGAVADQLGTSPDELARSLREVRERLYRVRQRRPPPLRDEKILAAWNGLMISAFAQASFVLAEPGYGRRAARAADLVLRKLRKDGRLLRVYLDGRAEGPAFLEDYAFLIAGLLDLYEALPDPRWLREAVALQRVLDSHYADAAGGGYFKTADDHERLLAREKPSRDSAVPSGNSVAALNLLRLAEFTGDARHLERANLLFSAFRETLSRSPNAVSELLLAVDYQLDSSLEIVLVRPADGGNLAGMLTPLRETYLPNRILAVVTEGEDLEAHAQLVPLVTGKRARQGRVTAYVCEDRVCELPTSDPEVFAKQIGKITRLD